MQTGERQSARLRAKYLEALLKQDVGFFDTDTSTGKFVQSISSDPLMVQDAISEKVRKQAPSDSIVATAVTKTGEPKELSIDSSSFHR